MAMAKCRHCGKSGLFLKLTENGLCSVCEALVQSVLKHNQKLVSDLNNLIQEISKELPFERTLELFDEAIRLCNKLATFETEGMLKLNEPATITRNKIILARDEFIDEEGDALSKHSVQQILRSASDIVKTRSHKCMLMYFLKPRTLTAILDGEWWFAWQDVLSENPNITINNFISAGLLKEGSKANRVEFNLTVPELKNLIASAGNKPVGNKQSLVSQAIELVSWNELSKLFKFEDVYICTGTGRVIGEEFKQAEALREIRAREKIAEFVAAEDFPTAIQIKRDFEALHPWPSPLGFSLNVDIPDPNKKSEIEKYKESGVVNKVKVLVPPNACEICQSFADKEFDLDSAPPLPLPGCMCNGKYVSTYSPITVSWKELGEKLGFDFSGVDNVGPSFEELAKKYNMSPEQVTRYKKNKGLS